MATNRDDGAGLNHPSVKKFGTVDGAKKDSKPTDTSAASGTTFAPGPMRPNAKGPRKP